MRLFAYQFQGDQPLRTIFVQYDIAVERYYQDTLRDRPNLQTLLTDCRELRPSYVLVDSPLSLGGKQADLLDILRQIWSLNVGVIAVNPALAGTWEIKPQLLAPDHGSQLPPSLGNLPKIQTLDSRDWMAMGTAVEQHQRRQNVRRGHEQNRLRALPPPGQAPYGYRRGKTSYLVDRRAAPVVRGFYENFLLYGCLRRAVRHVANTYGKSISTSTGKRWLEHPVYRGHLRYRKSDIISNTHPALLTPLEAAQIDRLLQRNQRFAARSASAPRSLSGLVHCASCGSGMTVSKITRSQRQYLYLRPQTCPNSPKCSGLGYDQVLDQTISTICDRLPKAIAALPPQQSHPKANLLAQINQRQEILAKMPELLDQGILDPETAQLRTYRLKIELSELEAQLTKFSPVNLSETAQTIAIPEFWHDLSETERRFYLREFIQSIQITRAGRDWALSLEFVFESRAQPVPT